LQEQWRQIGSAGRDYDDALWQRFRSAQDKFYERRSAFYERQNQERQENLRRKEHLCSAAESLAYTQDTKAAIQRVKEFQAAWKTIGQVPRDRADALWDRFRSACDRVFAHANEERARKQAEWQSKMRDTLAHKREQVARLRESIEHDEGNISRWRDTIYNLHGGGRADEIRDSLEHKISSVEEKIRSKRDRLYELEEAIRDIQSKL